jgi:hypothetical protein
MSAGEWVMQHESLRPQYRNPARAAVRAARQGAEFVEIAIISLAGLTLAVIEIAQHAGSAILPQMFPL